MLAASSHRFHDHGDTHPTTNAQRCDASVEILRTKGMDESRQDAGAAGADRMSERDRAAVDVDSLGVDTKLLHDGYRLHRECFVQLEKINLIDIHARRVEGYRDGRYRAHPHDLWIDTSRRIRKNSCKWCRSQRFGF